MLTRTAAVSAILCLLNVMGAAASGWEHTLTPYLWAVGQEGDTGVRDTVAGDQISAYDLSPGDILERLDGAFLLAYRAEKDGTWGILGDVVYMNLTDDGEVGPLDVDVEAAQLLVSAAYTRAFRPSSSWWWFAGLRYADLSNEIDYKGNGPAGVSNTLEPGDEWVDPFLGVQWRRGLSQRWSLGVTAEAGGFGAGSDATWQALAEAGVTLTKRLQLRFGYRWLDVDYDDNDFVFDTLSQGLILGLSIGL